MSMKKIAEQEKKDEKKKIKIQLSSQLKTLNRSGRAISFFFKFYFVVMEKLYIIK